MAEDKNKDKNLQGAEEMSAEDINKTGMDSAEMSAEDNKDLAIAARSPEA